MHLVSQLVGKLNLSQQHQTLVCNSDAVTPIHPPVFCGLQELSGSCGIASGCWCLMKARQLIPPSQRRRGSTSKKVSVNRLSIQSRYEEWSLHAEQSGLWQVTPTFEQRKLCLDRIQSNFENSQNQEVKLELIPDCKVFPTAGLFSVAEIQHTVEGLLYIHASLCHHCG